MSDVMTPFNVVGLSVVAALGALAFVVAIV